jgi:hypothetical protein
MNLDSQEKDQLYTALAQAQHEFPTIHVNRKAFKNEYADLYAILKPIYPILSKYGLSIRPWAGVVNGVQHIGARLMHKSGQYETNTFLFESDPCKNPNDQLSHKKQGALTYFNRNHIKDMLGVLIGEDPDDDDGQGHLADVKYNEVMCVTKDQVGDLMHTLKGYPEIYEALLKKYNIKELDFLPKDHYLSIMETIRYRKTQYDNLKK